MKELNTSTLKNIPPVIIDPNDILKVPKHKRLSYVVNNYLKGGDTLAKTEMLKYVVGLSMNIVGKFNTSPIIKSYINLINTGMSLFELTTIVNNIIKITDTGAIVSNSTSDVLNQMYIDNYGEDGDIAHSYSIDKNDESILTNNIFEITNDIANKHGIEILLKERYDQLSTSRNVLVLRFKNKEFIVYGEIHNNPIFPEYDSHINFITVGGLNGNITDLRYLEIHSKLIEICNSIFYSKISPELNYVVIDNKGYHIHNKIKVVEEIRNLPYDEILQSIKYSLENNMKRGYILVGNPGVGKTLVIHKLIQDFTEIPVFIIKNECLTSSESIKRIFSGLKNFKAILILDDFDGLDISNKNNITNEFLHQLDMNGEYCGITIATVNDPSKVNYTLMNRPGRFDEVHLMKLPDSSIEVEYVLKNKLSKYDVKLFDKINFDTLDIFLSGCVDNSFTHAKISSCVEYCLSRHGEVTNEYLIDAMNAAILFTKNAKLFSDNGELTSEKNIKNKNIDDTVHPSPTMKYSVKYPSINKAYDVKYDDADECETIAESTW